jgi:hypothetical protein
MEGSKVMRIICAVLLLAILFFMLDSFVILDDENYSILQKIQKIFRNFCIIVICFCVFVGLVLFFN